MKTLKLLFVLILTLYSSSLATQNSPFSIEIEPLSINGLGGLQSFSFGQSEGKWLLVGGRLDGLHRTQPWASFDVSGNNNQLIVVDPTQSSVWTTSLSSLPTAIQEQLSSTNMNFYQDGDYLYITGGYGYSATVGDHTTFPYLTAINVPEVINAIINNTSINGFFRQITDTQFQVSGGRLKKIDHVFHLLGGNKFLGRYNPNNNPTFTQEYTNQIRRFTIEDDGTNLNVTHLSSFTDQTHLHRRDYNAEAQILPNGNQGITMFSGVFQLNANLPFLNAITVNNTSYAEENNFQQYYNHYHCAVVPMYSSQNNEMHTVFFGGIAQYYDSNGTLVQDNNVPFVNTIARVTRDENGVMAEYKLPIEMPGYLGAGSEFIPNKNIAHYTNEVLKLDEISDTKTLIGYIFGGISSSAPNIFFANDGTQSSATNQIFKVYITKSVLSTHSLNSHSTNALQMTSYPNPNEGLLEISYNLTDTDQVEISISDATGKVVLKQKLSNQNIGTNIFKTDLNRFRKTKVLFVTLKTRNSSATQKIIMN